jgi:NADPH:quinone reductase-like Zn-dependent oxidoreductase
MRAVRSHRPGTDGFSPDEIEVPPVGPGEALVRVHAAAITRDELSWPVGRLPAIPSYELSGAVVAVAPDVRNGSGARVVSVAEEAQGVTYFVVAPKRTQLIELARLADADELRPSIDSVFSLEDAGAAFARVEERGKRGKVVLRVRDD